MIKEIVKGIILGFLIPMCLIGIIFLFFKGFERIFTMDIIVSIILLGIGINALIIRRLFKKNTDYLGRGIMITSFLFFFYVAFQYIKL